MCLILLAYQVIPGVRLQLAANRDELFARPTQPAGWWADHPDILAGRDLTAGGTWLGVSRSGRFAAITNFRDPASRRDDAPSRGALVGDFLLGTETPAAYIERISPGMARYNGFSLLLGNVAGLWFVSNRSNESFEIPPGVHGLSNHLLNEPWPKVVRGTAGISALGKSPFSTEDHFSLLADETQAADVDLPRTGIDLARERRSSAIRILDPVYGTRCSTLLRIADRIGESSETEFHERSFSADGTTGATVSYRFTI